jgi:hypothetical protein
MTKDFKLEVGKTYYPSEQEITITTNLVCGNGWQVEQIGNKFVFEFLASRHGGGVDKHEITAKEFEMLKQGNISFEDLLKKYDTV